MARGNYLLCLTTGRVFAYTAELAKRGDMTLINDPAKADAVLEKRRQANDAMKRLELESESSDGLVDSVNPESLTPQIPDPPDEPALPEEPKSPEETQGDDINAEFAALPAEDKDAMEAFALKYFDVDLDKRKSPKTLRKEIEERVFAAVKA